jgi:hypothetical protein
VGKRRGGGGSEGGERKEGVGRKEKEKIYTAKKS